MSKTAGRSLFPLAEADDTAWPLYPLTVAGGSVVGAILAHVMDASTVEMPPPPPLPQLIPVLLPLITLPPIPDPINTFPHLIYPGVRPITRSYSTGDKYNCHGRKLFEEHYGVKLNINGPHPFRQWFLGTTISSQFTRG